MANNDFWALVFEPITTALGTLAAEVHAVKLELATMRVALQDIARALPPLPAVRFIFSGQVGIEPRKDNIKMLLLTDVQKATLSIAPVDAKGNPAPVDGAPSWSVSDPTLLDIAPADDGLSAVVTARGPLGSGQVNVQADADLGAGVTTIAGTLDVTVSASQATTLNIAAGAPEPQ